ncbi:MAG: hypothetical protein KDK05_08965, partial [Candidatus Competibacteraceae bacterium]|nr:hypothetical protein [Candidatus Competibacteraceae bacterium]
WAAGVSLRQWSNDVERLGTDVLQPLREEMQQVDCHESFGFYIQAYLEKLKSLRTSVSSMNYLVFREMGLSIAQSLGAFGRELSCDKIDKWLLIESLLKQMTEYTGNIFSLIDVAENPM